MIDQALIKPATVLAISGGTSFEDKAIQIGALIDGEPAAQHIAVVHHFNDKTKTWWGIEGRPGGVGWVDCKRYIGHPLTVGNVHQPITDEVRMGICVIMEAMLGTPYDWQAIIQDTGVETAEAFGLPDIWHEEIDGKLPGHIVCSSLAAYGYDVKAQPAPRPDDYRHVSPADWEAFIIAHRWA